MVKVKAYILLIVLVSMCLPLYAQVEIDTSELVDSILINDSLSIYYGERGDLRKAQEYSLKNVSINEKIRNNSVPYAISVLKYARFLYPNDRDIDNQSSNKGLSILKDSLGSKSSIYIKFLLEYAWRQFDYGQIDEACKTIKTAVGEDYDDEPYLGDLYYSYAHFCSETNEKEISKVYALKAKTFYENKQLCDDINYQKTLTDLALLDMSNIDTSINYLNEVQKIIKKNKGENCVDYLDVFLNKAYVYRFNNYLEEALDYACQAKDIGEKIKHIDYGAYLYTLEFLAGRYSSLKQYDKAIKYAEKSLNLMKASMEIPLEDRLETLDSLIVYYSNLSNVEKINLYAKEAYLIRKSCNIGGEDLVQNLHSLLRSNYYLAKYEECESNVKEIKETYGDDFSSSCKYFYDDMDILMQSYLMRKLYKDAIAVSNEIEEAYRKDYGEESETLAQIIMERANIYTYLGEMDEYNRCSLKSLKMINNLYGKKSLEYMYYLYMAAKSFYNVGYYDYAYDMYKESTNIVNDLYGKMHIFFVTNYLSTLKLWTNDRGVFFDDYDLNDLYRCFLFHKIVYDINDSKSEFEGKIMSGLNFHLNVSLPNLLIKYKDDPSSINAIYKCYSLTKGKIDIERFKSEVFTALGDNKLFIDLCHTNNAYIKALSESVPEQLDSLYYLSTHYIELLSKESPVFYNYVKWMATMDSLTNNLLENEVIIDYIHRSYLGTGYVDYLVVLDKNKMCPDFVPITNIEEEIKKLCNSYQTLYFVFDNDSILSSFNIDGINANSVIGYESTIACILNRGQIIEKQIQDTNIQLGKDKTSLFSFAINEFEKGVNLYKRKKYDIAMKAFYQCDSLMYLAKGESSEYFGHGRQWIASCLHRMGVDSLARNYSEKYYFLSPIDMRQTIKSDSILDVAALLYEKGDLKAALEKYEEASKIEQSELGKNSYWYANTLSCCAEICIEMGEYERAIKYELTAINIRRKTLGVNHIDYYFSLKNLFNSYLELDSDNKKELLKYGELLTEFMEKNNEALGNEIAYYPIHVYSMSRIYTGENNKEKALGYCKKAIASVDKLSSMPESYSFLYHEIILNLKVLGEDSLAFNLCENIIPVFENNKELQNNENRIYTDILNIIANHYYSKGDFISTCVYQEKVIDILRDKISPLYGTTLSNLALIYCELGRIDDAIKLAEKAVTICETDTVMKRDCKGISVYATRLTNLAHCYAIADKPKEALRIGKKCYEFLVDEFGLDNGQTMLAASNLAFYYDALGYIDESKKILLSVIDSAQRDINKYGDILGTAYNNLAMGQLDINERIKNINKSYEIRKSVLGENDLYTIQSLYNKGRCLVDMGELSDGISCIKEALNQTKNLIGDNNFRYIEMMKILVPVYALGGDLMHALNIANKRAELLKEIVGEYHISYLKSIEDLSELYFYTNDTVNLYSRIIEESNKYRKMIISDFSNYTSIERTNAVNNMGRFFDWLFPLVCYYKNQPQICSELYNTLLLRKGLLLNSEIGFDRLVKESCDSVLLGRYNELIANKCVLNKQYQLPVEDRVIDVDSLKLKINEEEDYIVTASKEYGEYTKRFNVRWEDIKVQLEDDEISVEFVVFDDTCSVLDRKYYALLIEKNCNNPIFIPLCNETQIQKALSDGGKTEELYQLIWNPIIGYRNKIKTIYFSPCGILNSIGIEYVNINEYENITDKYNLYRLSSTREIINRHNSICKTAVLYGGLEYAVDIDVLLAQSKTNDRGGSSSVIFRGLSDSLMMRNSFEPLYNTKLEITEIGNTLKSGDVSVSIYSEAYGTEESFKSLSGKGLNLIHLATHGMYIGSSDAEKKKRDANLTFIQLDDSEMGNTQEDKSLSRSFLVMSGGDMLPSHRNVPDNLEDGILTSYEISKMDFRGLDLVVLSACQTALGDVDYEGVYGLQRGFKKAGANTILMSLDKVDDEATRILMVEFYRNLMDGKTKHQSLQEAQHYLRKVDNGKYDDPKYWASFIMLDGLN